MKKTYRFRTLKDYMKALSKVRTLNKEDQETLTQATFDIVVNHNRTPEGYVIEIEASRQVLDVYTKLFKKGGQR